ncbi:MAG TPA: TipAS antibiotic-recognition domain-containing protein, partial [Rectinemataceae bacterium]|nr:TipAS antibiotic-recognition domain-containing protein [Rectinemataceae bacterium]
EVKAEGAAIDTALADEMDRGSDPGSTRVRELMRRKAEWLRAFYEPSPELFRGLGLLYTEDERFKAGYERIRPGLADYLRRAMAAFADNWMT